MTIFRAAVGRSLLDMVAHAFRILESDHSATVVVTFPSTSRTGETKPVIHRRETSTREWYGAYPRAAVLAIVLIFNRVQATYICHDHLGMGVPREGPVRYPWTRKARQKLG